MQTETKQTFDKVVSFAILVALVVLAGELMSRVAFGSAPSGLQASFGTSSTVLVGPQVVSVASTSKDLFTPTTCTSRVITTVGQPISLMFSNNMISSTTANPTAVIGHEQLASTTVVYDSGQFGCTYVSAYGYGASTTITISEFR